MKARVVHTKIWKDEYFGSLNRVEKLVFIYLITNQLINICGIYEVSDREITFDLGITQQELDKAKQKLSQDGKMFFVDGWVRVVNSEKYQQYKGEKNEEAKRKELALIPDKVIGYQYSIEGVSIPLVISNKKSVISNKTVATELRAREVLEKFNDTMGTKFTSVVAIQDNLEHWLEQYTMQDVLYAIEKIKGHNYWDGKMTPEILLRQKNPRGERVDNIGTLLNYQKTITKVLRKEDYEDSDY